MPDNELSKADNLKLIFVIRQAGTDLRQLREHPAERFDDPVRFDSQRRLAAAAADVVPNGSASYRAREHLGVGKSRLTVAQQGAGVVFGKGQWIVRATLAGVGLREH